jgi:DNA-binding PadR family transcriptional regulator
MSVKKKTSELRTSSYVVLGLVDYGPDSTGYELRQLAESTISFLWATPSMSQIYAELDRLHDAGLVRRSDDASGRRPRITHRLTASGRAALRRWATAAAYEAPSFHHMVALRVLLGRHADQELSTLLEEHLENVRQRRVALHELALSLGDSADDGLDHARIVAEWGQSFFAAEERATRTARRRLDELATRRSANSAG